MTESSSIASAARWTPTAVRVRASSVLLVFTAVIAAVLVRNVFVSAHRTIAWAFATALLAVLLLPVVDRLARHMPRFLALVLTVVALAVISAGLWAGARSTIVREAENLKSAPRSRPQRSKGSTRGPSRLISPVVSTRWWLTSRSRRPASR